MSRLLLRSLPFALALVLLPGCDKSEGSSTHDDPPVTNGTLDDHAATDGAGDGEHHAADQVAADADHHADGGADSGGGIAALGDSWSTTPAGEALTAQIDAFIAGANINKSAPNWRTRLPKPPVFDMPSEARIVWLLQTNKGPIRVRLWQDVAPMHVSSTLYLTRLGFYDELSFHRVIPKFMAQGGCPLGNGRGGPGYSYGSEFKPGVGHDRPGLLSMANTGAPNSDGSQFFLTFRPTGELNNKHTVFGEVIGPADLAVLRELEQRGGPAPLGRPTEPLIIEQAAYVVE